MCHDDEIRLRTLDLIKKRVSPIILSMSNPIARLSLEKKLNKYFRLLPKGKVLDLGTGRYWNYREKIEALTYHTIDIRKEVEPDIVGDAHCIPLEDESVDIVIATELLEHCHTPQKVINEIFRVLTRGGVCLLSTRFIYVIHGAPLDYYRFTNYGLSHLFRKFRERQIISHGNKLGAIWDLFYQPYYPGRLLFLINPFINLLFFWDSKLCPCGYIVYAKK